MIIGLDIETQGLDATKFILGTVWLENRKKGKVFYNKSELYKYVIDLGIKEAKRGKMLNVYSHNASYDTAGYVDLFDKHLIFFSNRPFIWAYRLSVDECLELNIKNEQKQPKEIIKFLDTVAIFKMPLKKLGQIINLPKLNTPPELMNCQIKGKIIKKTIKRN